MAKIYRGTKGNLQFLAQRLRAGELVAVPSETVYGLAADALSASACRKIFRAKGRPPSDPLIVHVGSVGQAGSVAELSDAARQLMRKFWPGPLTMVLPKKPAVPEVVTSGQPSVAIRMPAHPLFLKLLAETGTPLAAPSANPFGYVSPTTAQHVQDGLGKRIKYILEGGASEVGVESTIVDLRDPRRPRLLRPGKITKADLERVLGVKVELVPTPDSTAAMLAPGMMLRHYSPHTPVIAHRKLSLKRALSGDAREAWVFLTRPTAAKAAKNIFGWAETSSSRQVAHNLFALLRKLDGQSWKNIHVECAPRGGLGDAINDRLTRAAAKTGTPTPYKGQGKGLST